MSEDDTFSPFGDHQEEGEEELEDWTDISTTVNVSTLEEMAGASFDVLSIVSLLDTIEPPREFELHTFSYLACLLYVFDGYPASSWGYTFSAVPPTVPFSTTLSSAVEQLVSSGLLDRLSVSDSLQSNTSVPMSASLAGSQYLPPERFALTADGLQEFEFLSSLQMLRGRSKYLSAATSTSLIYSVPAVVNSLVEEPQLRQALRTTTPQSLLVSITSQPLYEQFEALREAIGGEVHHLSVPATVYVGYLDQQTRNLFPEEDPREAEGLQDG